MIARLHILVVGHTLEAFAAAAWLKRKWPHAEQVRVRPWRLPPPPLPRALATSPRIASLHQSLKLSEADIMRSCHGAWRLATIIERRDHTIAGVVSCSPSPQMPGGHALLQYWLAAAQGPPLHDYNPGAAAALADRIPATGQAPGGLVVDAGYVFDGALYADFWRRCAAHMGAQVLDEPVTEIELGEHRRAAIRTASGARETPDLVIDCAGEAIGSPAAERPAPRWSESLQSSAEAPLARTVLRQGDDRQLRVTSSTQAVTSHVTFARSHRRHGEEPWRGNIIAIGRSAAQLAPGLGFECALLQAGLEELSPYAPVADSLDQEARRYNEIMRGAIDRLADFEATLTAAASMAPPPQTDEIVRRATQFASRGRVVTYDHDLCTEDEWTAALLAAGVRPRAPHIMMRDAAGGAHALGALRNAIDRMVKSAPGSRAALVAAGCAARPPS